MFSSSGGSTLIWSIVWLIMVKNEPSKDKFISKKELLYILSEAETTPRKEVSTVDFAAMKNAKLSSLSVLNS